MVMVNDVIKTKSDKMIDVTTMSIEESLEKTKELYYESEERRKNLLSKYRKLKEKHKKRNKQYNDLLESYKKLEGEYKRVSMTLGSINLVAQMTRHHSKSKEDNQ